MCTCFWVDVYHVYASLQRPEEDIKSPEATVTDSCELRRVGAYSQTLIFWKSIKCP